MPRKSIKSEVLRVVTGLLEVMQWIDRKSVNLNQEKGEIRFDAFYGNKMFVLRVDELTETPPVVKPSKKDKQKKVRAEYKPQYDFTDE